MPTWEQRLQARSSRGSSQVAGDNQSAIAEKSDYEVEFRILLRGGTVKYIHTVGHPVFERIR